MANYRPVVIIAVFVLAATAFAGVIVTSSNDSMPVTDDVSLASDGRFDVRLMGAIAVSDMTIEEIEKEKCTLKAERAIKLSVLQEAKEKGLAELEKKFDAEEDDLTSSVNECRDEINELRAEIATLEKKQADGTITEDELAKLSDDRISLTRCEIRYSTLLFDVFCLDNDRESDIGYFIGQKDAEIKKVMDRYDPEIARLTAEYESVKDAEHESIMAFLCGEIYRLDTEIIESNSTISKEKLDMDKVLVDLYKEDFYAIAVEYYGA